jgi:uncharacterized protein (TIGR03546 family)
MWLLLIKSTRWLYKTLNADVRPWQVGLGVTLGALAGLLPPGLAMLCVFVAILLVNVHFGSALFSFGLFRLLGWAMQQLLVRPAGAIAVGLAPHGLLISAAQSPVLSWLRLDYFDVAGAILIWLVLAVPLMAGVTYGWSKFRPALEKKLKNSRLMKWASKVWLFKGLKYVFLGS